jgi:hypothetical protein
VLGLFKKRRSATAAMSAARPAAKPVAAALDADAEREAAEYEIAERQREALRSKVRAACSWDAERDEFVLIVVNQNVGRIDRVSVFVVLENVVDMRTVREFERTIRSIDGGSCYVESIRREPGEGFGPEPAGYAWVLYAE